MGGLTFYFDRCCGKKLPTALQHAAPPFAVVSQNEIGIDHDTPDDQWISDIGSRGWVIFSHDSRFHRVPSELAAIKSFKVKCFLLPGHNSKVWDKACYFVRDHKEILRIVTENEGPFIRSFDKNGQIRDVPLAT